MWTKDIPCKEGWYWVKRIGILSGNIVIGPGKLYRRQKNKPELTVFIDGDNYPAISKQYEYWNERITEPTE